MKTPTDFVKLMWEVAEYGWGTEIYQTENNGKRVLVWKKPNSYEEYEFKANGNLLTKEVFRGIIKLPKERK